MRRPKLIPKGFPLGDQDWEVRVCKTNAELQETFESLGGPPPKADDEFLYGVCMDGHALILLNEEKCRTSEELVRTYLHEFVHALFYAEGIINHDEEQVERFARHLHQALKGQYV